MIISWNRRTLGELCSFQRGLTYQKSDEVDVSSNIILRANNVDLATNSLNFDELKFIDDKVKIPGTKKVKKGALLICVASGSKSHLGKVAYIDRDYGYAFGGFMGMILPGVEIDPRYLFYLMTSGAYKRFISELSDGTNINNLKFDDLARFDVPFPPLPEQRRIVALLDEAFAGLETLRANAEKNVQNAQELFDSYLNAVLAGDNQWTDMAFDEFCAIDSKLVDPREPTYLDLPHIGAGNMVSRTGEIIDVRTAREEGLISGKFFFDSRMVLYSKIRPYLMKACRPDFDGLCSADVYPLLPKPGIIDRNFLFYLLMTRRFTDYAIEGSARAGMPKVNREHLFAYPCKLPNLKEQRALAKALDSLQDDCTRLKSIFENKLAAIDELKQSILHQAFSGQLTKSAGIAA